jgi:hypothetical protein
MWTLVGVVVALLIMFALVVGPWLFTRYPHQGLDAEEKLKAQNDVRTTLVQALAGLAVAAGAYVTYRTYRQNQRDQEHRRLEQDRTYRLALKEQASRQAEQDRVYRLNEAEHTNALYTKAVEQLGHDQAPVRLGALYSLERLAQTNTNERQTVVDVLCAYLRMPYTPPVTDSPNTADGGPDAPPTRADRPDKHDPAQELQVRRTAQRILASHLRRPGGTTQRPFYEILFSPGAAIGFEHRRRSSQPKDAGERAQLLPPSPDERFWPGISIDLTGAILDELDLTDASLVGGLFDGASFIREAFFYRATFSGAASFRQANFQENVFFTEATFTQNVPFNQASFAGIADFAFAIFKGRAWFGDVIFSNRVTFREATFADDAYLDNARVLSYDPAKKGPSTWPPRWTVQQVAEDREVGKLVKIEPQPWPPLPEPKK